MLGDNDVGIMKYLFISITVLLVRKHSIKGKRVEVKKALSRQEMDSIKRKKEMNFGRGGGGGMFNLVLCYF